MRGLTSHLLSLYRRSNSNIFIFRDASRAGELLVPKSGPKSALNPESAHLFYTAVQVTDGGK